MDMRIRAHRFGMRLATGARWALPLIIGLAFLATAVTVAGQDKAIYGQVYKSDHTVASGHQGAWVAIIVNHSGTNYTYEDPNGLDNSGWYSITLPGEDKGSKWAVNDTFRVQVDGTSWGDENFTAHNATGGGSGHDYTDNIFVLNGNITQQQDVETLTTVEIPEFPGGLTVVLVAVGLMAARTAVRRPRRR